MRAWRKRSQTRALVGSCKSFGFTTTNFQLITGENLDAALREASEVVERLEREVESLSLRGESLKRERDAWKRVARGNGQADSNTTSSAPGEERLPAELMPTRVDGELLKQLEERSQEAARLREELGAAQRQAASLGAQLAKAGAQVSFQEGDLLNSIQCVCR